MRDSFTSKIWPARGLLVVALLVVALTAAGQSTNGTSRLSYDSFRVISDQNIFNPNRYARGSSRPTTRAASAVPASRVESISLVGTLAYDKGTYAFFDGTSGNYKKTLQVNEVIGRYRLLNISENQVQLADGTNTFNVKVGMQMRREDEGEWFLSESSERTPRRVTSTRARTRGGSSRDNSTDGTDEMTAGAEPEVIVIDSATFNGAEVPGAGPGETGGIEADGVTDPVLLRLMQRREQMTQ